MDIGDMIEIIILFLSVYGTSKLLVEYDGYKDVFYKLRGRYEALRCVICCAVWVALILSSVYWLGLAIWLLPLAVVGAVILIEDKL